MAWICKEPYAITIPSEENELQYEGSPLFENAAKGNYDQVLNILNSGVPVNAEQHNKLYSINIRFSSLKNYVTPLQIAAANGHDKCVQLLIDHGADVHAKDHFDATALHLAAEKGNYSCVKVLLDAGADHSPLTKQDFRCMRYVGGTTPLHLATANNHVDCVTELFKYGADFNAVNIYGHTSLYIALQKGFRDCALTHFANFTGKDVLLIPSLDTSNTPLHYAVCRGMIDCIGELLKLGSDVNHINFVGCSPLHHALNLSDKYISDQLELVKLLVLEGYNTDINCPDLTGLTPLHHVCFNSCQNGSELAKFLISQGANVNIKHKNFTLLEYELKTYDGISDTLEYIIKSMLHVPPLKSLYLYRRELSRRRNRAFSHIMYHNTILDFAKFYDFPLVGANFMPPENESVEINSPNIHAVLPTNALNDTGPLITDRQKSQLLRKIGRHARQQPFGNDNENKILIFPLKKQQWYEELASNPRTLQHYCRYVIRSYIGSVKQKNIERLQIPDAIKSYLLLEGKL